MKKTLASLFLMALAVVLFLPFQTLAKEEGLFDEFGIKEDVKAEQRSLLKENNQRVNGGWEAFPHKSNVPMDKEWSIDFSGIATHDKIDAIVIERNKQYIPVKITFNDTKKVKVKATESFSGNAAYTLKILLTNGKKYKMDFTTASTPRDTSDLSIGVPGNAFELYLNEKVKGHISTSEKTSFYKVEVPSIGTLDIDFSAYHKDGLYIGIYGNGTSNAYNIAQSNRVTQSDYSIGVSPGTYYIKVHNSIYSNESDYDLEVNFTKSSFEVEEGKTNITQAPLIELGDSYTSHIGYRNDSNKKNSYNYYKVEVPKTGVLDVGLISHDGVELNLNLYGRSGDNKDSMRNLKEVTRSETSLGVTPGTYYIRVAVPAYTRDKGYTPYEVEVDFTESSIKDDIGTESRGEAHTIDLNTHFKGHIGYANDNTTRNNNDYFKLEVPSDGTLNLGFMGHRNLSFSIALLDGPGDDRGIAYDNYVNSSELSAKVTPGTYYIRVKTSVNFWEDYSTYDLDVKFTKN